VKKRKLFKHNEVDQTPEPAGRIQSNLVQIILGWRRLKFIQIKGQVLFKGEIITKMWRGNNNFLKGVNYTSYCYHSWVAPLHQRTAQRRTYTANWASPGEYLEKWIAFHYLVSLLKLSRKKSASVKSNAPDWPMIHKHA
jgi:hypothetical protein